MPAIVETTLQAAAREVGVVEVGGNNFGPRVRQYLADVGLPEGQPWCAAFVSFILHLCGVMIGLHSGDTWALRDWARKYNAYLLQPSRGDVFELLDADGNPMHTGFVTQVDGNYVNTIEGNTGMNSDTDGDGVARKSRLITACRFINWAPIYEAAMKKPGSPSVPVAPLSKNVTVAQLQAQLRAAKANGLFAILAAAAKSHKLFVPYVLAVASRETNLQNILGDGGHGVGVMQVDDQHQVAAAAKADGSWQTHPERLVDVGVSMMASNLAWAQKTFPKYSGTKIAAAAYNAGQVGATRGVNGGNVDLVTTGGDYGADVVARTAAFAQLLAG